MIEKAKEQVPVVETGIFGADMKVSLIMMVRLRYFWMMLHLHKKQEEKEI
ncbi:MAG: hypothetical protein ACLVAT_02145 [Lachnospiraceae bacterium]